MIIGTSGRATVEPQSLLKAESDLTSSCSATDSGPVEGKLGRCVVAACTGGSWWEPELGDLVRCKCKCKHLTCKHVSINKFKYLL